MALDSQRVAKPVFEPSFAVRKLRPSKKKGEPSSQKVLLLKNIVVRLIGLEPTRLATPDPKSGASTNFATGA